MRVKLFFRQRLGLMKGIIIASFLAVIIIPGYVILHVYPSFKDQLTENAKDDSVRIANHLASMFLSHDIGFSKDTLPGTFHGEAEQIRRDFLLMKMKVFAPSGEVIYSSDAKDIGIINREPYFSEVVAKGKPYAKVVQKDTKSLEGQIVSADVVETYVPVMRGTAFIGAFEIYLDITERRNSLNSLIVSSYVVLLVMTGLLLAAILKSALKAGRTISEREQKENEIIGLYDMMFTILDRAPFGVYVASRSGAVEYVNKAMLKISGTTEEEFMSHNVLELETYKGIGLSDRIRDVFDNIHFHMDSIKYVSYFGKKTTFRNFSGLPFMEEGGEVKALVFVEDVTARKEAEERILAQSEELEQKNAELLTLYEETKALSLKDPLTGLANRRYMDIMLDRNFSRARRYERPFAVIMADIDYFKRYNDTHGHQAGDSLLAKLAGLISSSIREADTAIRYGGEEFLILLPETADNNSLVVAERIRKAVAESTGETISLGVASYDTSIQSKEELVAKADQALYMAKKKGRNRVEAA